MKGMLALLVALAACARANPGEGRDEGGWGQAEDGWGDHTEYQTHVVTTAVVSQYYQVRPSICETHSVWTQPPVTSIWTTISTWTEPGHTKWHTSYVPCTTTLPGTTETKYTTYTTEVTDISYTTIYKPTTTTEIIIITSNNTITLATTVPTTIPTTQLISTTEYVPTTIETTELMPTTYTQYSEVTGPGTTKTLAFTQITEVTIVNTVPTTVLSVSETIVTAQGPTQTLLSTLPGETITGPTISTTLFEYSTILLNGTTQVITLPQSTVVEVEYSTLPAETIIESLPGQTIIESLPGETIFYTATAPTVYSYVTITQPPVTITEAPPPPASTCNATGFFPGPDGGACGGESCYIDFDLDANVHWDTIDHYPPLLTVEQFENPSAKATCITTLCNTAAFEKFYTRSIQSCARPPCPSNSLDCDCNIVVGPLVLPNGETTSVTQTGTSGWYLNLGPMATAVNVPSCSSGQPQCLTSVPSTRSSPLLYTGSVIAETGGNMSIATPTQFLLPQLPGYFPADSPFGDCSTAVFDPVATTPSPRLRREHLHRRQQERFANPFSTTWPATNGLTDTTTYTFQSAVAPENPTPIAPTQPLTSSTSTEESSSPAVSSFTVTQPPIIVSPSQAPMSTQTSPTNSDSSPPPTNAEPPSSTLPSNTGTASTPTSAALSSPPAGSSSLPVVSTPAPVETRTTVISGTTVVIAPLPTESTPSSTTQGSSSSTTQGSSSSTSGEPVGSSIATPTTGTIGPDGRVTFTETVFYSMIASPRSESLSGSASATSTGPAQQSSDGIAKQSRGWLVVALAMLVAVTLVL